MSGLRGRAWPDFLSGFQRFVALAASRSAMCSASIHSLWGLGLLPLMIGLGYLASWWLNWREQARG